MFHNHNLLISKNDHNHNHNKKTFSVAVFLKKTPKFFRARPSESATQTFSARGLVKVQPQKFSVRGLVKAQPQNVSARGLPEKRYFDVFTFLPNLAHMTYQKS